MRFYQLAIVKRGGRPRRWRNRPRPAFGIGSRADAAVRRCARQGADAGGRSSRCRPAAPEAGPLPIGSPAARRSAFASAAASRAIPPRGRHGARGPPRPNARRRGHNRGAGGHRGVLPPSAAPGCARGAAPPCGRGSSQNHRQRGVESRFLLQPWRGSDEAERSSNRASERCGGDAIKSRAPARVNRVARTPLRRPGAAACRARMDGKAPSPYIGACGSGRSRPDNGGTGGGNHGVTDQIVPYRAADQSPARNDRLVLHGPRSRGSARERAHRLHRLR